jgi:hypothetical protein
MIYRTDGCRLTALIATDLAESRRDLSTKDRDPEIACFRVEPTPLQVLETAATCFQDGFHFTKRARLMTAGAGELQP